MCDCGNFKDYVLSKQIIIIVRAVWAKNDIM